MHNGSILALFISGTICLSIHSMDISKKVLCKGALITMEGIDCGGKAALAKAISIELTQRGFDVVFTKELGSTELSEKIDTIIKSPATPLSKKAEYLLFAANRAQQFQECIIPALQEKKLIICDCLTESSIAYQGYGQKFDINTIKTINRWAMDAIKPDFILFLDPPIDHALECHNKTTEPPFYGNKEFLDKVKEGFQKIYHVGNDNIVSDDGTDSPEELSPLFCAVIEEWLRDNDFYS